MTDKFAFIDAEKAMFPIVKMCTWLRVSPSGFYAWRDRPASATARRRARLAGLVQAIFDDSDGTYHYPPRHIFMFNVLYCDGHVVAIKQDDLRNEMEGVLQSTLRYHLDRELKSWNFLQKAPTK